MSSYPRAVCDQHDVRILVDNIHTGRVSHPSGQRHDRVLGLVLGMADVCNLDTNMSNSLSHSEIPHQFRSMGEASFGGMDRSFATEVLRYSRQYSVAR